MVADNKQTHRTRESEDREQEKVHVTEDAPWQVPTSLAAPPPRKGMVQRWIRVGSMGRDDPINISRKTREGWRPRKADSVPPDFDVPRIDTGRFAGCIGVEGMVLMEMPKERNDQRNAFYRAKRDRATAAINMRLEAANVPAGHGFGRIQREESSKLVREVSVAQDE